MHQYWQLPWPTREDSTLGLEGWIDRLDELLHDSVRARLVSDVPLGVFLSGGLDSSSVAYYAQRSGLHPLRTFTIGSDSQEWDESEDARRVANHFETEHHLLRLSEADMLRDLPHTVSTLARHFDEPFGDSSALPTYFVSRLARQHVTVALSGDGGDELLAGYDSYKGFQFAQTYRLMPSLLGARFCPGTLPTWRGILAAQRSLQSLASS